MNIVSRRLIILCVANGLDPASIWDMTVVEFALALADARRKRAS